MAFVGRALVDGKANLGGKRCWVLGYMSALCSFAFGVLFILDSVHTGKFSVRVVEVWILRLELRISIQLAPCCQVSNYGAESWSIFPVSFARERMASGISLSDIECVG